MLFNMEGINPTHLPSGGDGCSDFAGDETFMPFRLGKAGAVGAFELNCPDLIGLWEEPGRGLEEEEGVGGLAGGDMEVILGGKSGGMDSGCWESRTTALSESLKGLLSFTAIIK